MQYYELHIEKKGRSLNTLKRFRIYNACKQGLQLSDILTDSYDARFDIIINAYTYN
jgi:hypothetical protein